MGYNVRRRRSRLALGLRMRALLRRCMTPGRRRAGHASRQIYRMTARALLSVRQRHASLCIENPHAACIICKTSSITVRGERNTPGRRVRDRPGITAALLYTCMLFTCAAFSWWWRASPGFRRVTERERFIGTKDECEMQLVDRVSTDTGTVPSREYSSYCTDLLYVCALATY